MMATIRAATHADADELGQLSGQLGYPADAATVLRRLDDITAHHGGVVLVAVDPQGGLRGFAHVEPRRLLIAEPFAELAALVVSETARGQRVGSALLAAAEAWARERGFASMRVRSNVVRERAHRFYLREGYAEKKRQAVFVKRL
ncbi:MAG: GNAT family N-acetyltransferase, partial [Rhodanobacteraceae bacterium]